MFRHTVKTGISAVAFLYLARFADKQFSANAVFLTLFFAVWFLRNAILLMACLEDRMHRDAEKERRALRRQCVDKHGRQWHGSTDGLVYSYMPKR